MKEPTEHLTMAELLAVLRERLPEWPPIKNDESKIRAALQVLTPEQLWLVVRRGICDVDILNQQNPWYKLSAILLGKDVNLLSRMSRYREAMDRAHAAVGDAVDRRRERDRLLQMVPVRDAGLD